MNQTKSYPHRLSDMISGAVTHGVGVVLAFAGAVFLVAKAVSDHLSAKTIASVAIFGSSLVLAYVFSTLYHSLVRTRAFGVFRILDHSLIYLLIAGTYTPITLIVLPRTMGFVFFCIIWALAALGIVMKSIALGSHPILSTSLYVLMGWMAVFFIVPLCHLLPTAAIVLLFAGGIFYTVGIVFFAFGDVPYFHSIWHLFVLAGSVCHYFMILFFMA